MVITTCSDWHVVTRLLHLTDKEHHCSLLSIWTLTTECKRKLSNRSWVGHLVALVVLLHRYKKSLLKTVSQGRLICKYIKLVVIQEKFHKLSAVKIQMEIFTLLNVHSLIHLHVIEQFLTWSIIPVKVLGNKSISKLKKGWVTLGTIISDTFLPHILGWKLEIVLLPSKLLMRDLNFPTKWNSFNIMLKISTLYWTDTQSLGINPVKFSTFSKVSFLSLKAT